MKKKNAKIVAIIILIIILLGLGYFGYKYIHEKNIYDYREKEILEINKHYNKFVKVNKDALLYDKDNKEIGKIGNNTEIILGEIKIDEDTKYFPLKELEGYYIKYQDVDKIEELSKVDDRYKNYIVFNKNIVTNDRTSFYNKNGNLVYEFNESFDLPIIINDSENYGVEYNNRLLYVKKEDVKEIKNNQNTTLHNASGVGVLNYHAFYDESNEAERLDCTSSICHSKKQFKTHLDFFKENGIFTLKMDELEMYVDGKLQLPKSVLITIDDGPKTTVAVDMLTEYKMNATIFLVTSWFNVDEYYKTDYIELHSHTHNLHDGGDCPGGQGGGLKCLPEETILADLKASRDALHGSTALCYPFYEYNDYSIRLAKEAGFTMGFIGESSSSDNLVHVGDDKFRLRRFIIATVTTMQDFSNYFNQIK